VDSFGILVNYVPLFVLFHFLYMSNPITPCDSFNLKKNFFPPSPPPSPLPLEIREEETELRKTSFSDHLVLRNQALFLSLFSIPHIPCTALLEVVSMVDTRQNSSYGKNSAHIVTL
jgi:hypothetical protein